MCIRDSSITEPSAHPIREIELAAIPATRPRTPSPVIQAKENQARALACRAARNHLASRSVWIGDINGASSTTMRARLRLIVGGGSQGVVHTGTQRIRVEVLARAWCQVNCELVLPASHFNACLLYTS